MFKSPAYGTVHPVLYKCGREKTFKRIYERMIAMLLGFVFFAGVFEFAGLGLFAKIALSLLFDVALWAFVFRREIQSLYNAFVCRRREERELRARVEAKHAKQGKSNVHRTAAGYYYF